MKTLLERIDLLSPSKQRLLSQRLEDLQAAGLTDTRSGDGQLVAYLVCSTEDEHTADRLRDALRASLPDYMMPSAIVLMDAIPRRPSGKVDRRALPSPNDHSSGQSTAIIPPRNDAEETLVRIWTDVLGSEEISVHDNFFEIGGNSLLVNRVVSRARETFDIELTLRDLFEAPTIARFAEHVEQTLIAELESMPEPSPPGSEIPSGP